MHQDAKLVASSIGFHYESSYEPKLVKPSDIDFPEAVNNTVCESTFRKAIKGWGKRLNEQEGDGEGGDVKLAMLKVRW